MPHDILTFLGTIFIGSAALVGIAVFLGRALLSHLLSKDIEQHKAQLQTGHAIALERLRSDLRLAAFEHETRFARLHEKRAEVIAELYKRLVKAQASMERLIRPLKLAGEPDFNTQAKEAADMGNAFMDYYSENQIYFDESLCEKLNLFRGKMSEAWTAFFTPMSDSSGAEIAKFKIQAWEKVNKEVPQIRTEIEKAFRELLGHGTTPESLKRGAE